MASHLSRFGFTPALLLLTLWAQGTLDASEARVRADATINGQSVHLVLDTGSTEMGLFRRTAERLKLQVTAPTPGVQPPPGFVRAGLTEPCDFVFQTITARVQFAVFDLPAGVLTDVEGAIGWYPIRSNVLVVDAAQNLVTITNAVPSYSKCWTQFELLRSSRILGFRIPSAQPEHNAVYVDTGSPGGVNLNSTLWKPWVALRRLDMVVDGINGVVYAKPSESPPPPFGHNRLGAVFVPLDLERGGDLLAHVVPGGPAFRAGVRDNDVLLKIDDLDVTKWRTDPRVMPLSRFGERPPDTVLKLELKRDAREFEVRAVLENILGPNVSWTSE